MEQYFTIENLDVVFNRSGCEELDEKIQNFIDENVQMFFNWEANPNRGVYHFSFKNDEDLKSFFTDLKNNKNRYEYGKMTGMYGKKSLEVYINEIDNCEDQEKFKNFMRKQLQTGEFRIFDGRGIIRKIVFTSEHERAAFIKTLNDVMAN